MAIETPADGGDFSTSTAKAGRHPERESILGRLPGRVYDHTGRRRHNLAPSRAAEAAAIQAPLTSGTAVNVGVTVRLSTLILFAPSLRRNIVFHALDLRGRINVQIRVPEKERDVLIFTWGNEDSGIELKYRPVRRGEIAEAKIGVVCSGH